MRNTILAMAIILLLTALASSFAAERGGLQAADFDQDGNLIVPDNLDKWVFLGSSLGMGYSQDNFNQDSPGMFQIVRIEPQAYEAFLESGEFVDGTMIALHFFGSQNELSISRAGFVMDELQFAEIHHKDSERYPDGFNFFTFDPGQAVANEVPLPNECVACHVKDAAYDGVFVQFYPTIHEHLPADVREKLAAQTAVSAH